ncbi:hypothetical protein P43SY_005723 [Pythium insidiosum]|uniref:Phosphatidic acid phosphatase type 2/haloperoxidase domain-containing protein n=1 Tax=Pythium insidiosum TaxID=114742 RepID=A0AAD5MJ65_PYTIN|nr:hypothetical protein P43SY_005723 [Pythium insidiosum]
MRSSFEVAVMLVVTGITNFCMFPAILQLYRHELVFEAFVGMFTMLTSFMYHVCDSIDGPLWLTEGQWHRLDNIGSIMSFVVWALYLMDLRHPIYQRYLQYFFLGVTLVFQEKNPWDEINSVIPIVLAFATLFTSFVVRGCIPKYDYAQLRRGFLLLGVAVCCFIKGLDDDKDPFRFFHGCWHAFIGSHTQLASSLWMLVYGTCAASGERDESNTSSSASPDDEVFHSEHCSENEDAQRRLLRLETGQQQQRQATMTLVDVLYAYDLTIAQLIFQRFGQSTAARVAWEVLSHTGDGILWFLMVLPVVGVMWLLGMLHDVSPSTSTVFVSFYTCNFVDIVAIIVMKLAFKRDRPPHHRADGRFVGPDQHSFPSGHATRVWCLTALFLDLCSRHPQVIREFFGTSPAVVRAFVLIWALSISFSRIALGRHYPSDVLAGALIGLFVLYPIASILISHLVSNKRD